MAARKTTRWVVIVETDDDGVGDSYGPFTRERAEQIGEFLDNQIGEGGHAWVQPLTTWTRANRTAWIAMRKEREADEQEPGPYGKRSPGMFSSTS